jgi:hypothetical protein
VALLPVGAEGGRCGVGGDCIRRRGAAPRANADPLGADASTAQNRVAGVTRVTEADRREGVIGYEVESERGHDIRRQLAQAVVGNGWGLLELRPMRLSLEEIFLSLTTDETAAAAPETAVPPAQGDAAHA